MENRGQRGPYPGWIGTSERAFGLYYTLLQNENERDFCKNGRQRGP